MTQESSSHPSPELRALERLGAAVRKRRGGLDLSRGELATRSGLSLRFLAQLEKGEGNISYLRLRQLAHGLETDAATLVGEAERMTILPVALVGMRGAGKSAVGRRLARRLDAPFVELTELVEDEAGMSLDQVFELQGGAYYRQLERDILARYFEEPGRSILAAAGGVVTAPETFALLRRRAYTVWLKASPRDHWNRVVDQGDRRPLADRPQAMAELERLWEERAPRYAEADLTVETSDRTVEEVAEDIIAALPRHEPSSPRSNRTRT